MKRFVTLTILTALVACSLLVQAADQKSTVATTAVNLTVPETVSVSVSGGPIVINASTGAATSVTVTSGWQVTTGHTSATLYAWFSSATAAIANSTNVPSSAFISSWDSGSTVACTLTHPAGVGAVAGAGCATFALTAPSGANQTVTGITHSFSAWLSGGPAFMATLPAGSYTGTMNFLVYIV